MLLKLAIHHLRISNYNIGTYRGVEFPVLTKWIFMQQQTAAQEAFHSLDVCFQNAVYMFLGLAFVSATQIICTSHIFKLQKTVCKKVYCFVNSAACTTVVTEMAHCGTETLSMKLLTDLHNLTVADGKPSDEW